MLEREIAPETGNTGRDLRWRRGLRRPRLWWWNAFTRAWPAAVILVMGYGHRWMSDDGLIYTRTVRQILAGNGPAYNPGERAEASTSALWQWLLALTAFVTRLDPAQVAVFLGLGLSVAGFWLAADAAARLHGAGRALVPAGALVMCALPPVWDFATSGLETGLDTFWIALTWRALVTVHRAPTSRRAVGAAFLAGLGPLVRPEDAIFSVALLAALYATTRPPRRQGLRLAAAAAALPAWYEFFRAGYYGELLPLPAISKTAGTGHWARGLAYLEDFTTTYGIWVALALAAVLADAALRRQRGHAPRTDLIVAGAPALAGTLYALYVVWVGGDFMHARMLLPPLLMLMLPVFVIPADRRLAVPAAALAVWALVCAVVLRVPYVISPGLLSNERVFYLQQAGVQNPDSPAEHAAGDPETKVAAAALATGDRILVLPDGTRVPLRPGVAAGFVLDWTALGINGVITPLGDDAVDPMGLGYPLAAHLQVTTEARAGHDKWLPDVWVLADYGDPAAPTPKGIDPVQLAAARRALSCGALAQIQASAREPMTIARFFSNLWHAPGNTETTFPADPVTAEHEFCG